MDVALLPEVLQRQKVALGVAALLTVIVYAPVFPPLFRDWVSDPNYGHGFIVPAVSLFFVYRNRAELQVAPVRPESWGIVVVLAALGSLTLGRLATEYFTQRTSLIVLLAGVVVFFFGRRVFSLLALPLGYLLFMVPIPYILYDTVAFPLKLFVASASVWSLKLLGVVVWREGNIIQFPNVVLEVADACSGLRSLISLLALGVAYAWLVLPPGRRRWLLLAAAVPTAIFTNGLRVVLTGVLAQHWGARAAEGFFHEFAGFAVFGLAAALLFGFGEMLRRRAS